MSATSSSSGLLVELHYFHDEGFKCVTNQTSLSYNHLQDKKRILKHRPQAGFTDCIIMVLRIDEFS